MYPSLTWLHQVMLDVTADDRAQERILLAVRNAFGQDARF
jgi:hypothetical protein